MYQFLEKLCSVCPCKSCGKNHSNYDSILFSEKGTFMPLLISTELQSLPPNYMERALCEKIPWKARILVRIKTSKVLLNAVISGIN